MTDRRRPQGIVSEEKYSEFRPDYSVDFISILDQFRPDSVSIRVTCWEIRPYKNIRMETHEEVRDFQSMPEVH